MARAVDRQAEGNEEASAVHANRRRAGFICVTPGLVAGVVVGLVLVAFGLPLIGRGRLGGDTWSGFRCVCGCSPRALCASVGGRPAATSGSNPDCTIWWTGSVPPWAFPGPTVCVVDSAVPNAMAVGRDPATALLVVTSASTGPSHWWSWKECWPTNWSTSSATTRWWPDWPSPSPMPWSLIAGTDNGAGRVHSLVGRGREFSADQRAAVVVRYPPGIGSALSPWWIGRLCHLRGLPGQDGWPHSPAGCGSIRWRAARPGQSEQGNLDDTRVRAGARSLR